MKLLIHPLPTDFLHRVRSQGVDDQGNAVELRRAAGGEPCRDVLRRARPGEEILLASHSPFAVQGPYKEYGPVFVLANASEEPVRRDRLPLPDGSDTAYFKEQFALRAYSHQEHILDASLVTTDTANAQLEQYLARANVAFVHARFPTYGCFACRITRAV